MVLPSDLATRRQRHWESLVVIMSEIDVDDEVYVTTEDDIEVIKRFNASEIVAVSGVYIT